jgi:polyprenyl-phospho-N-acetylgalactosaminyl synthase
VIEYSTYIIIPAYNESKVLDQVLLELTKYNYQIILVDDGSSDDTYEIAAKYPIHLLHHVCNLGQGAALQTGITYALNQPDANIIVTFDADGQHHPEQINDIIEPIRNRKYDVVLGSRFINKYNAENMPASKSFILKLAVNFTKLTTHLAVTDTHNGLRAFSRVGAGKIKITQNGMSHASQILKQIQQNKMKYCEVAVTITYTDYSKGKGQSILNLINILWESFFGGINKL